LRGGDQGCSRSCARAEISDRISVTPLSPTEPFGRVNEAMGEKINIKNILAI
jgi:hypothetical protein